MPSPNIPQGLLNRVKASVVWPAFPNLNVTAPYLGKEGVRLALEGESTVFLPTMTGAVTSPEPYMMISLIMNLLKTQALADAYKTQMETTAQIGDGTVYPDISSGGLSSYSLVNCAIEGVRELN